MRKNINQGGNFLNLQYFCQFIQIAQENKVLETLFYIFAIDFPRKSIIQPAITENIEFGIRLSFEIQIIITFK